MTPCSSSADCLAGVFASRCRVVVEVSLLIVLRFCLGQRETDDWKIRRLFFQYQEDVECVCILNDCFSSNYDICPDNYNYSRFTLKDKCRSEKWEVYLYGDMTIKVMESIRAENCGGLRSCISWCEGKAFWTVYTGTRPGVLPPSERGRGGGDAGSLLPGVLPPELVASSARARTDSPCRESSEPPTPPPQHHHHHHHHHHHQQHRHHPQKTPTTINTELLKRRRGRRSRRRRRQTHQSICTNCGKDTLLFPLPSSPTDFL